METNKTYNENCLDTMSKMPESFVDLTVTSPPYDGLRNYNGYSFDFENVAKELFRVTKAGGVVVWIVGDSTLKGCETGTSFKQALHFISCGFNLHDTMIYAKDNPPPVGGSSRYYQQFEYMFVFSKGKPKAFNPVMTCRRNKHNDKRTQRVKGFTRSKDGSFQQRLVRINESVKIGNIWTYVVGGGNVTSDKIAYEHPAIFPEKLANDHIISWSNVGDLVYDPFAGSGTTLKMAMINDRKFIGSEISKEYCSLIDTRLDLHKSQPHLFSQLNNAV